MGVLKEAAIAIGDHVTAPLRKGVYEMLTGEKVEIERITLWSDEGEYSQSQIKWILVPEGSTKKARARI